MGSEFGQLREWSEERQLDWDLLENEDHAHLAEFVKELNKMYTKYPAMYCKDTEVDGFKWINPNDNFVSKGAIFSRFNAFIS